MEEYASRLDLNRLLAPRPEATYFMRAASDALAGRGIRSGDIVVVDRSLRPSKGDIVVAPRDGVLALSEFDDKRRPSDVFGKVVASIRRF